MAGTQIFDQGTLKAALIELGHRSYAAGWTIKNAIYGGSAMLTLNYRVNTRDVDGVFQKDKDFVKKLASDMAGIG
jgi:hypothetical protein